MIATLTSAVNDAMEAMFFDAAEPVNDCDCGADGDRVTAYLKFHDAVDGEFMLSTPRGTAMALAASFMGLEAMEVDRTHAEQTICELGNIICGSALSRLDPARELRLSSPVITDQVCAPGHNVMYQHYRLLDGCLAVSLRMATPDKKKGPAA